MEFCALYRSARNPRKYWAGVVVGVSQGEVDFVYIPRAHSALSRPQAAPVCVEASEPDTGSRAEYVLKVYFKYTPASYVVV